MRSHSRSVCTSPPTGPVAQSVGAPTEAVRPLSAEPPVNSRFDLHAELARRCAW